MVAPASPDVLARAATHAALGDPHRLRICDELLLCDRSPSELAVRLGMRSNLLAHHLFVLARAGLIETSRSAGDRRRRYVRLRPHALERLRAPDRALRPASVLFVCRANSARSPLAAALWRQHSDLPADSAGTHPARRVHPLAVTAARRHGLDLAGVVPRAIGAAEAQSGNGRLVVTVCDEANEALPAVTGGATRLHWSIADPVGAGRRGAFNDVIAALRERIEPLCRAVAPAGAAQHGT